MMTPTALLHLLQLASPSLPVGAYSYSQGLESAIEDGSVRDAASARDWIATHLREVVALFDAPVQWRLLQACAARDGAALAHWSECFLAARDTAEFRAETVQMGYSLGTLLMQLWPDDAAPATLAGWRDLVQQGGDVPLPAAYACAAAALDVPPEAALLAMLFSQVENQVLVCVKSVPLGQVAGQRLLLSLRPQIEAAAQQAQLLDDDELSNWAPGLSLLSMRHETQYSRLYRS